MNGSHFVTLNVHAPSMHGLQVSGQELCHRGWPSLVSRVWFRDYGWPNSNLSTGCMQRFLRLRVYWP